MQIDLQDRSQYLSLALFSQNVIASLLKYLDESDSQSLEHSLSDAVDSLQVVSSGNLNAFAEGKGRTFDTVETLQTLKEVWTEDERDHVVKMMRELLAESKNPKGKSKKKQVVNELIDLFLRLQNQALWNFELPRSSSNRQIRELCGTL